MTTTTSYVVNGMTCDHCVKAVAAALEKLPRVREVVIALDDGRATVTSDDPLDAAAVRAAVQEAGYELAFEPEGSGDRHIADLARSEGLEPPTF